MITLKKDVLVWLYSGGESERIYLNSIRCTSDITFDIDDELVERKLYDRLNNKYYYTYTFKEPLPHYDKSVTSLVTSYEWWA